jgi:hypothetical protein
MERLRLWRYKKLTNDDVKEDKAIEKHSDDEDYNSCFKLKKQLKVRVENLEEEKFFLLVIFLFTTMHPTDSLLLAMSNGAKLSSRERDELIINEELERLPVFVFPSKSFGSVNICF